LRQAGRPPGLKGIGSLHFGEWSQTRLNIDNFWLHF
jgi:hypothetical protein